MEIRDYTKIIDYTPGRVMGQVMITRKPPHYLPETPGELFFGIPGNDYLFHDLPAIFGNLIYNNLGAHSNRLLDVVLGRHRPYMASECDSFTVKFGDLGLGGVQFWHCNIITRLQNSTTNQLPQYAWGSMAFHVKLVCKNWSGGCKLQSQARYNSAGGAVPEKVMMSCPRRERPKSSQKQAWLLAGDKCIVLKNPSFSGSRGNRFFFKELY